MWCFLANTCKMKISANVKFLNELGKGEQLKVTFLNGGTREHNVVKVSLKGFKKGIAAP